MEKIPLILLTGFLGAGKTTLLNRWLKTPAFADSAVLINEFGEIALDHDLIETIDEGTVVLDGGCICCTVRGALPTALRTLFWQRHDRKLSQFNRVIIETTGLADPAPIIHELMAHPTILHHYRLAGVVACVDALFGLEQLDKHPEAMKQAAVADCLLLTKTDLTDTEKVEILQARLHELNPAAKLQLAGIGETEFLTWMDKSTYSPHAKQADVQQWIQSEKYRQVKASPGLRLPGKSRPAKQEANRHGANIQSYCLTFDEPLPWGALITALEILAAVRGEHLLRVKGIINAEGHDKPQVIHGVQNMFFPPLPLAKWPDDRRESRLVFIVQDLESDFIAQSINHFIQAARQQKDVVNAATEG